MKARLIIASTLLPLCIVGLLFKFQREQVNPELDFTRKLYNVSNRIIDKIKLPINSSPDYFAIKDEIFYLYSIENKCFQIVNKKNNIVKYPNNKFSDSLKLVLSFIVDSNKIISIDQNLKKIVKIDSKTGSFTYKNIPSFTRGIPLDDSLILLASIDTVIKDRFFYIYNANSNQKKLLNVPLSIIGDYGFANDGFFDCSDKSKKIIYVLYHLGKVITFDKQFQEIKSFNTIDNYRFNPLVVQKGDRFYLSRKTVSVNSSATIDQNSIYIVSELRSLLDKKNNIKGNIIGIYEADSPNKYKYSIHFGNEYIGTINDIKAQGNFIYLMTYNEIIKIDLSDFL